MANSMGLPIPVVGVDTGPNWANAINNCLNLIAEHTHAAGSGVQITPTGLNINAPLLFNGNPAQSAAYLNMLPQGVGVSVPINDSLYVNGIDLFFRDGVGNAIRITQGGNVLASSSGISLGTASASFIGNTLTVIQSPGVAAPIDAASYILRYNGSYPTPAGIAVVLQAPSSQPATYALTFPTALPTVNNSLMASNTAGALSFRTPDQVGQDMTAVGANAVANSRTRATGATVGIGGVAISASSASFSYLGLGPFDVTNLSVTITTSGRPIVVGLMCEIGNQLSSIGISNVAAQANSTISILRGATIIAKNSLSTSAGTGSVGYRIPPGGVRTIDFIAAGTYTYKVQMAGASSTDFGAASFVQLIAYEL